MAHSEQQTRQGRKGELIMNVTVERCWSGGNNYSYRFKAKGKPRIVMHSTTEGVWCRSEAIRAKDMLSYEWDVNRQKIRFI